MSTLYVDNLQPNLGSGVHASGHVVQVVSTSSNTSTAMGTANTWTAATDLSVSITPKFSNSKIMIIANVDFDANAANRLQWFTIFRDSTNLGDAVNGFSANVSAGSRLQGVAGMNYLDSPNTTSLTTYYVYSKNNGTSTYINLYGSKSTITVMEIAQ